MALRHQERPQCQLISGSLGMCEGVILHVTYVECGERTRITSAGRAEKHEQDDYYRENAG